MQSQKYGAYYIIIDSTKGPEMLTVDQSKAAGNKLYLIATHPDTIVNWDETNGMLTEIIISFKNNEYIYYSQDFIQRFYGNDDNYVVGIEPPIDNVIGMLPVVKLCARTDDLSQIRDVSELNKIVFNLDSLLIEELFKNTFSQVYITGINPDDLSDVNVSGRKVITIKRPDAKILPVSADASQAASIRESIHIYEKEIYRAAGLQQPDVVQNTESGRALKLRMNEVQQIAADIADNAEKTENYIVDYWSKSMSMEVAHCDYPEDFQTEDMEVELKMTLDMLGSSLPRLLKNKQTLALAKQLFPKMGADEMGEIVDELENPRTIPGQI